MCETQHNSACFARAELYFTEPSIGESYPCINGISYAEVASRALFKYLDILRMSLDIEPWRPARWAGMFTSLYHPLEATTKGVSVFRFAQLFITNGFCGLLHS